MSSPTMNIYFDYGGYYTRSKDGFEWHLENIEESYGISFKTSSIAEITYADLVARICKKVGADESKTRLRLSFIPYEARPYKRISIRDDDDVQVYLSSLDSEQRRSYLNVEVLQEVEMRKSSNGGNYGEYDPSPSGMVNVGVSPGVASVFTGNNLEIVPRESTQSLESDSSEDKDGEMDRFMGDDVDVPNNCEDVVNGEDNRMIDDVVICEHDALPRREEESESLVEPWEDGLNLEIGREFESKEAVKLLVERAMHENCYGINLLNSDKNRYVVKCSEAGKGCKWSLRVTKLKDSSRFSVRTYNKLHTCSRTSSSASLKKRGTPGLVASVLKEDYTGSMEAPSTKSVIGLVQGKIGVEVSYSTARRGKKKAIENKRGTPEEEYLNLFSYLHALEEINLGTKTSVSLDDEKRFKFLFIALGACIEGFQAARKVIIVDATFLNSKYGGVLIFASAQDPDNHIYPLAFVVVDGENNASWRWFFEMLQTVITDSYELVICSDRNASLIKAVREVYPNCHHEYCLYHLSQNVKAKVGAAYKEEVSAKFIEIGHIYLEAEFLKAYGEFRDRFPSVATYLDASVEVHKWARCYFPGERYNIDTTNCAESLNSTFKHNRSFSLLRLIDKIIDKIIEWFNKHRKEAKEVPLTKKLVPVVEKILHDRCGE